ncbi:MAG TPA: SDR family NAD(P)-dependent oxidoreductase [Polyangia bacterium]|jgi:NAD(P)-dependent dehydrogenase (short-subunit alcohol dehydrogenase family)|nr:SDR family NAD(P)-dependent oxidoreductase [Polyangia bacterium]
MKNPIAATLQGLLDRAQHRRTVPPLREDERLDGKVALVTGANRGLGKSIALQLAQRGAHVIMACRSGIPEAGEEIRRACRAATVEMRQLDLGDLRSVLALCEGLAQDGVQLDRVVLNAGLVARSARPTVQGLEVMFGVNYLANFLLVEQLRALRVLRRVPQGAAAATERPRIVFVSSESHRDAGPVDLARFGQFETYGAMDGMRVYSYSKLLLTVYAGELSRQLGAQAGVHACCPGAVNTDIAREAPAWVQPVLGAVMARFFRTPDEAAEPILYLCCAHALEGMTGTYLHLMQDKPPAEEVRDPALGARLYRKSQTLIARLTDMTPEDAGWPGQGDAP